MGNGVPGTNQSTIRAPSKCKTRSECFGIAEWPTCDHLAGDSRWPLTRMGDGQHLEKRRQSFTGRLLGGSRQ